jgi:hypothetical protein
MITSRRDRAEYVNANLALAVPNSKVKSSAASVTASILPASRRPYLKTVLQVGPVRRLARP